MTLHTGRGAVDHAQFLGGFVGVYDDVACVVARLRGSGGGGAILINAHIDSAANAPGASDDLLAVGVLLESLNYFSKNRPQRDLIILINGAEETHQLAAHAFATQHPWAKDVRFVVNLESMGSGGRESIFRCVGEDVVRALRGTTVARGSVFAEELFRAVLWRAARTDYAEFLRALPQRVRGVDVAFLEDGYAYHTAQDSRISLESTSSEAATLVDVVERLGGVDDAAEVTHGFVFFDFLGLIVVGYSASTARVLHGAAALAGLLEARRRADSPAEALHALGQTARAVSMAALAAASFGAVLSVAAPMRWYAGGVPVALVLFVPPAALGGGDGDALALWSLLCGLGALFNVGAAYAACAALLGLLFRSLRPVALVIWIQIAHTLLLVAVPLLGRVGSRVPLDAAVGALVGLFAGLIRTLTPPWPKPPHKRVCFSVLVGLLVAATMLPPFTAARPKRLALQHVSRDLASQRDSGLWVLPLDGSRLRGLGNVLSRATPVTCDKAGPGCYLEYPFFFPFSDIVRGDVWLDAPQPDLAGDKPATLVLTRDGDAVDINVEGPSHQHIVLRGYVLGWSFAGVRDAPTPRLRAEGVYLAQLTCGRAGALLVPRLRPSRRAVGRLPGRPPPRDDIFSARGPAARPAGLGRRGGMGEIRVGARSEEGLVVLSILLPLHLLLLGLLRGPAEHELRRVQVLAHDRVHAGPLRGRQGRVRLGHQARVEGHLGQLGDDLLHERALLLGDDRALQLLLRGGLARGGAADARGGPSEVAAREALRAHRHVRLLNFATAVAVVLAAAAEEARDAIHGATLAPRRVLGCLARAAGLRQDGCVQLRLAAWSRADDGCAALQKPV